MIEPTQFFKCLSEDIRLQACLLIHKEGELCVCELTEALNESQPKISRHLAQLRNCGILDDTRRGQWVFYSVSKELPQWASDTLSAVSKPHSAALASFQEKLKTMSNRPNICH